MRLLKINQAVQKAFNELKSITKMDFQLYDEQGQILASTKELTQVTKEVVGSFLFSLAEGQEVGGVHFFKVHVRNEEDYVLLVAGASDDIYMIGKMAVCQVENLLIAYKDKQDLNNFLQNLILDNLLFIDIHNRAKQLKIETEAPRGVFVIETQDESDNGALEIVKGLLEEKDFFTTVDVHNIIVIKHFAKDATEVDMIEVAKMLLDMLNAEAMSKVRIGFGNMVYDLTEVSKAYKEAKLALDVSRIFYGQQTIVAYSMLGIGRIIYQLPLHLCEMFIDEIFGGKLPEEIDEEALTTIHKFFENNLNVSETSRQLYVHRNTLVYRLEKIQKATGLDIRAFEDAMTFRIALMVIDYMNYLKEQEAK